MAEKFLAKNQSEFWKEIKRMNNSKTSLPQTVDGVFGNENISKM